jgi:hypothetical protein
VEAAPLADGPLSEGEIHFLWSFIQGSIMIPETRRSLRRAWGMCQRHAFGFLAVDAAFRHGWMHGPALLYADLMERARGAFALAGPFTAWRLSRRVRETGPCLMCSLGYGLHSPSLAAHEVVKRGSDLTEIRRFARATRPFWDRFVCGRCRGDGSALRCRPHLREDLARGLAGDIEEQAALVRAIAARVRRYARSFRWEERDTDTMEDRAGLIAAVGWCGGWDVWLGAWLR